MVLLVIHNDRERAAPVLSGAGPQPRFGAERAPVSLSASVPSLCEKRPRTAKPSLLLHLPLQLLHLCLDYQVNRFVGCDYHIKQSSKHGKTELGWADAYGARWWRAASALAGNLPRT